MALRAARVGLVFDGDQLTIRSWFRTQALQLDVIESASCVNYDGLLARSNIDPMMLELTIHDGAEELRLPVRAVAGGDVVAAAERFNHELRRRRSGRSPL
jgi:hypothetical protein